MRKSSPPSAEHKSNRVTWWSADLRMSSREASDQSSCLPMALESRHLSPSDSQLSLQHSISIINQSMKWKQARTDASRSVRPVRFEFEYYLLELAQLEASDLSCLASSWYWAMFSSTFCAALILSRFSIPPVPAKARNWSFSPYSEKCCVGHRHGYIQYTLHTVRLVVTR